MNERPAGMTALQPKLIPGTKCSVGTSLSADTRRNTFFCSSKEDRAPIELDDRPQGRRNGLKQRVAREIQDDGIIDGEQRPGSIGCLLKLPG